MAIACALGAAAAEAQPYPTYDFAVHFDAERHVISGTVRITRPAGDSRPRDVWWFHLPPNRFARKDSRGPRQRIGRVPFGARLAEIDTADPAFPDGFSAGNIEIMAIRDEAGRALAFSREANAMLPQGFWPGEALLRVETAAARGDSLVIEFTTQLPQRYWDGWTTAGIFAEQWYPVLLDFREGAWMRDVFQPSGGTFRLALTVSRAGWVLAGREEAVWGKPGAPLRFPDRGLPSRAFPLLVLWDHTLVTRPSGQARMDSLFTAENQRNGALAARIGAAFADFMQERYGLPLEPGRVTFVQSDSPTGEIRAAGNIVVIPLVYYKNPRILNRLFLGRLSQAMAEIWFGETVWANRDTETWLHLGVTGFLSLEFFEHRYGPDAGIHDLVDWLSPKFREHFFETAVLNNMRAGTDAPLSISLHHYPYRGEAMVALYQKAPLVWRSLAHAIGKEKFAEGLKLLFAERAYRSVTSSQFQEVLERVSGRSLERFFRQWFHGVTHLDYQLVEWKTQADGAKFRVTVKVRRNEPGIMPVELLAVARNGEEYRERWDGEAETKTFEFHLSAPLERVVLDPGEYLLDTSRQNNHSRRNLRLRPFYDWSKERESLATIFAIAGGNAIDGNIVGIGTNIRFNQDSRLRFVPIYAQKTSQILFEADFRKARFLHPRLTFLAALQNVGGQKTFRTGLSFDHRTPPAFAVRSSAALQLQEVGAPRTLADNLANLQQEGKTNNILLSEAVTFLPGQPFSSTIRLEIEHAQPAFSSDFRYTTAQLTWGQAFDFAANHALRLEALAGLTKGETPIQKKHLLGDPLVLRGFPRTVELVSDRLAALRLEYRLVLTRRIFGENLQTRRIVAIFFYDIGKGWANDETFDLAPTRKDIGFGLNLVVNGLSLVEFPLRVEIAFPLGDPVYKERQVIFFQALTFF